MPLIVGSVRDESGRPVEGASVDAFDAQGRPAGAGETDRLGTFALELRTEAAQLVVRCRYCATAKRAVRGETNLAVIVTRYHVLEHDVPDEADLSALPYGRVIDAFALTPYVVPSSDGASVSDRGLGGGHGLAVDALAPLDDLSAGRLGFANEPDRYARVLDFVPAGAAFRYGAGAGGGLFAFDQVDPERSSAAADTGPASALVLEPRLGSAYPAAGVSSAGGVTIRRADFDLESGFAGGALRIGATAASSQSVYDDDAASDLRSVRAAYSTASRRYRTFADLTASALEVGPSANGAGGYRSSYVSGSFRLERPGPLEIDAGAVTQLESGSYSFLRAYLPQSAAGAVGDDTLYLEARTTVLHVSADAALALSDLAERESPPGASLDTNGLVVLPSLALKLPTAGALYARAGFSESLRIPTLDDLAERAAPAAGLEATRDELAETALGYDAGGTVRGELMLFREFSHGFDERRLDGVGASLVWQIAPRISLRAWTLRDDPVAFNLPGSLAGDVSRQVIWAMYDNPRGLRVDALARREAGLAPAVVDLDADLVVPLLPAASLVVGTSRRAGVRRYGFGLRLR